MCLISTKYVQLFSDRYAFNFILSKVWVKVEYSLDKRDNSYNKWFHLVSVNPKLLRHVSREEVLGPNLCWKATFI